MAGLCYDAAEAINYLKRRDGKLKGVMARCAPFGIEPPVRMNPFQMLMRSITYQQLSGRAAATIYGRVSRLFRNPRYPKAEELSGISYDALRGAGLSNAKTLAVQDLAKKTLEGVVPTRAAMRRMDDETLVERLTEVRGVGRWTVEMLLMFYLGRPDVFPEADLGVRKGIAVTYGFEEMPAGEALTAIGEQWRPYRSVGSWYMWRAAGMADGTESPVED